jgi:tetratricopeptide (TPR) repeat protein
MKKINFCALGLSFLLFAQIVFPQTSTPNPQTKQLREQALKLYQQKQYREALELTLQIVRIKESELGPEHTEVARALYDAAIIEIAGGQIKEGEKTLMRAIAVYESKTGLSADEYIFEALMFETLGYVKYRSEMFEEAIDAYRRAIELKEKHSGFASLETAKTLWQLANVHLAKSSYKKASELYERVAKIRAANVEKVGSDEVYDALRRYECTAGKSGESDRRIEKFIEETEAVVVSYKKKTVIKAGIVNSRAIRLVKPSFPIAAIKSRARSKIEVLVTIDETGTVIFACAKSGDPVFYKVSEDAAIRSNFSPTFVDGEAVKVSGIIVYNFIS